MLRDILPKRAINGLYAGKGQYEPIYTANPCSRIDSYHCPSRLGLMSKTSAATKTSAINHAEHCSTASAFPIPLCWNCHSALIFGYTAYLKIPGSGYSSPVFPCCMVCGAGNLIKKKYIPVSRSEAAKWLNTTSESIATILPDRQLFKKRPAEEKYISAAELNMIRDSPAEKKPSFIKRMRRGSCDGVAITKDQIIF